MAKTLSGARLAAFVLLSACDVEPVSVGTGGVAQDHGLIAVLSDYTSVQIALLAVDGSPRSESFLSSGSAPTSGLAFAFSGDTVLPSSPSRSGEVVLVDRFGTNVVSWANPRTAEVRAQLAVGTGFESNPRDYLEISARKAYLSRFGENANSGREPFDGGGNVLVIDPSTPAIVGSIELPRDDDLPPRPSGMTLADSTAIVTLGRISRDFATTGEGRLVGIDVDRDEIAWAIPVVGFKGCGTPALSPSASRLIVSCSGAIDRRGALASTAETGIAVFDVTAAPPRELQRWGYETFGSSVQPDVAFAGESLLLAKTQTELGGADDNALFSFDLVTAELRTLARAAPSGGQGLGLVYGGLRCIPDLENLCLLADAASGTIRRFDIADALSELPAVRIGGSGLPPIDLGVY